MPSNNSNTDNQNNDQNSNNDPDNGTNQDNVNDLNTNKDDSDLVQKLVQEKLDSALKDIKEKLDKSYNARDNALKKIQEFEQKEREAELKRLQDEGKHKEAYELQLAEEKAKRETLEKRNIELTRDIEVRNVLGSQPFRNDNALEMAYREIVGQLVQNEQGVWVHRSGVSVRDFVKNFAGSDENSFLFKPKVSNGGGSSNNTNSSNGSDTKKSLFDMSQEEVLKMATEGKLRKS